VFDKPIKSKARTGNLNDAKLIREGIATMPPRMKLTTLFDLTHERIKTNFPMSYSVRVSFNGIRGKRITFTYPLELDIYYGLEAFRPQGMHQLAAAAVEIQKILTRWTGRRGRLNVWTKDEDYLDWDEQWQTDRAAGQPPSMAVPYPAGRPSPSRFRHLREPLPVATFWMLTRPIRFLLGERKSSHERSRLEKAGRPDLAMAYTRRQRRL